MFNKRLGYLIVAAGLLAGCGTANGVAETTDGSELVAFSETEMTNEIESSEMEIAKSGLEATQEDDENTSSLDPTQQSQNPDELDASSQSLTVSDDGSMAAEGSWDEDDQDPTGETGEPDEVVETTDGAVSDYTQCAYYKTKKGKEQIEFTLKNSFIDWEGEIPSAYIKKKMDTKAAQASYKDLLAKYNCKNEEESCKYRDQVLNEYVDIAGLDAYYASQSGSSGLTPQQQQQGQEIIDSGMGSYTGGGDSGSSGGDGGYIEDPLGGGSWEDEWDWHDTGIGECAVQ